MPKTSTTILAAALILTFAIPAMAFPDPTTPFLAATTIAGTGWARFDFTSDGSTVEAFLTSNLTGGPATVALLVTSPSTGGAFMITLMNGEGSPIVRITSENLPEGVVIDQSTPAGGFTGAGITLSGWTGELSAIAYTAGNVADTSASLFGATGTTLTGSSQGVKTFMATEGDFEGTINAQANLGNAKPGVIVGDFTRSVGGPIVGQYFSIGETNLVGVTTQQASVTTPAGDQACLCFWTNPNAAPTPGDYTFHLTYVGATFVSNVFLAGADLSG